MESKSRLTVFTNLHCWKAFGSANVNGGTDAVVLQSDPEVEEPVVSRLETPPLPNPSASDIVKRNLCPAESPSCVENDPLCVPTSNEEAGIDTF